MIRTTLILIVFVFSTTWYGCGSIKKFTMHQLLNKPGVADPLLLSESAIKKEKPRAEELIPPPGQGKANLPLKSTKNQEVFKTRKIDLQKRQKVSLEKIQSRVDADPPLPQKLKIAKHITLNFDGTELYNVITTFSELLQLDYIIEGNIEGVVTLQTFNKIPVEDLYSVLEQILAINNITIIKRGNFYRFLPAPDAVKKPMSVHLGTDPNIPDKERMIMQIIPLQHISVESMKKIVSPLLTTNASFIEIPETNNLMMIEMAYNVKRIVKIVEVLDLDKLASSDIQLYKLRSANSETLVKELEDVFTTMGYKEALGGSLKFLSLDRLNAVLVVNSLESPLSNVEFWINELDQPISEGQLSTFVYYIQNGDAATVASLINSIFADGETGDNLDNRENLLTEKNQEIIDNQVPGETAARTPESKLKIAGSLDLDFAGKIIVIPDPDNNSLIIRTSPRNYPGILALLEKIDLFPQQVLIEVLIVDLTIDESTDFGVNWAGKGPAGSLNLAGGVNQALGPGRQTLGSGIGTATATFLPGGSFFIGQPDKIIAQLQLFASDSRSNVLANPILVTSDNKAANISITDEVPINSTILDANTTTGSTSTTVEYRSVGIKLDITPKINSDNFINLKIKQEISSEVARDGSNPGFNTRLVNTEVVLKDNQVLVMGGLMRTDSTESVSGVPFLKDMPYIGWLFGTKGRDLSKTELMIFITPHVISNSDDSDSVTRKFRRRLQFLKTNPIPVL